MNFCNNLEFFFSSITRLSVRWHRYFLRLQIARASKIWVLQFSRSNCQNLSNFISIPCIMGNRVGFIFLFALGLIWACDARQMFASEASGESRGDDICGLCGKYVTPAFEYLEDKDTQTAIVEALHTTCSMIPPFKNQCLSMVDDYTEHFFIKLSQIQPDEICRKLDLCEAVAAFASEARQGNCEACHDTVSEVVAKLKDPETKLKIIRLLLKECKSLDNYQDKCKKMVFEYGPLILADVQKYLEKTDLCALLHVCPPPSVSHPLLSLPLADS
ncbi:PREDICTED: proactivator polypeptide-like 1 isoform X2 [Tarenaya hassleriana]|uniref:proactivator polypeptide-like 1 isoform X2 n=1 Tax=Tarenaya hassleriana TaxID=28532 RepID=UPI00053C53ED|nr:PREDICTED: proactivator polypeptide-like 1 isoform X2 [Tarenaya hassleriana]